MKRSLITSIVLILALAFIAFDRVLLALMSPEKMATAHTAVIVEFITQTLCYTMAVLLNFRYLLPKLLYRGRFLAYGASLIAVAVVFPAVEVLFELFIIIHYDIAPGIFWYFSEGSILFFELLSTVAAYSISFAGTGVVALVWQWQQSGQRVGEFERRSAQTDLARERSKINMQAMFDVLDEVAAVVRTAPARASELLMALSKSLREQLYRSDHRKEKPENNQEDTFILFNISQITSDIILAAHYRWLRLLMLFVLLFAIGSASFDGSLGAFAGGMAMSAIMLGFISFNVYILVPRLLQRGRLAAYIASLIVMIVVSVVILVMINADTFATTPRTVVFLSILTNIIKFIFLFSGTTVFVLFQLWLRNEIRISQLSTATMRSELEQLQNQVNPHFLFNMLNNIMVLIKESPEKAISVLARLSDMLHYQFDEFGKQRIRLGDDIRFLTDYLKLEKLRRDRFDFTIDVEEGLAAASLPPMLFIPFVENAVKHGNDSRRPAYIRIRFEKDDKRGLRFTCLNSKASPTAPPQPAPQGREWVGPAKTGGLGLINVRRRLELLYGRHCRLTISDTSEEFCVQLKIPI